MANELAAWSDQLAATVEMAGQHVVALQNPNNTFAAGILWPMADSAVVVTANHALHQQEIHGVLLPSGRLENRAMSGVPLFPPISHVGGAPISPISLKWALDSVEEKILWKNCTGLTKP